jgi:ABC-type transport system involved in cytochrome c biogenesis permease component
MFLFLFKNEIKKIGNRYNYYFIYWLISFLFIFITILLIGINTKIINYIGIHFINLIFFIISIFSSSLIFEQYKYNGILKLFLNTVIKYELFIFLKCFIYWIFVLLPICFLTLINIKLLGIENIDSLFVVFIYSIYTCITIFINSICYIISIYFNSNIISIVFNQLINIPIILLCTNIISFHHHNIEYTNYLYGLLYILILILLINPFLISIIFYHIKE